MAKPGLLRNMAYNVAGTILPLAVSLVVVPGYIHVIGTGRYGIVAIAWLMLGYFGFLDLGLSRATVNALSRLATDTTGLRGRVIATSFWLNIMLGLLGGFILYWALVPLSRHVFAMPPDLAAEVYASVPVIVCMLPLGMIGGVASGALQSREKFLLLNMLQTTGYVAGQVIPLLVAIWIGPSIEVVLSAALAIRSLTIVALYFFVIRTEDVFDPLGFSMDQVRSLFGYGAWVSVSSILNPVLETFDQFLIGALLGPVAVTHYVVPMNLAMRSQVLASALDSALFPRLSQESGTVAAELNRRASVALAYGFGAICGPAIILVQPFFQIWLGADFAAQAGPIGRIVLVGAWLNGLAFLPYGLLQAQRRPDITAKIHLVEVLPFLATVYGLVKLFGLPGAALAWTLRNLVDNIALNYLAGSRIKHFLAMLPAVMVIGICFVIGSLNGSGINWLAFGFAVIIGLVCVFASVRVEPTLMNSARRMVYRLRPDRRPVA